MAIHIGETTGGRVGSRRRQGGRGVALRVQRRAWRRMGTDPTERAAHGRCCGRLARPSNHPLPRPKQHTAPAPPCWPGSALPRCQSRRTRCGRRAGQRCCLQGVEARGGSRPGRRWRAAALPWSWRRGAGRGRPAVPPSLSPPPGPVPPLPSQPHAAHQHTPGTSTYLGEGRRGTGQTRAAGAGPTPRRCG